MEEFATVSPIKKHYFVAAVLGLVVLCGVTAGCESKLTALTLTPTAAAPLPKGTKSQLLALGTYSDGTQRDVTGLITWASDNPAAVAVADAMGHKGLVTAVGVGRAKISGSYGEQSATVELSTSAAVVTAIAITPPNPVIASGTTVQLIATGLLSDGTTQDVTALATWTSLATQVAALPSPSGAKGLATAMAPGTAVLLATLSAVSAQVTLGVKDATLVSLALTPVHPTLAKGTTQPFTATGTFSDRSTQDLSSLVSWSTSDASVATVASASATAGGRGVGTAVAKGTATLSAIWRGVSGATALSVTDATLVAIAVTPHTPVLAKGTTQQFIATGIYSDSTTQDLTPAVLWTVANSVTTSISNTAGSEGLGWALAKGLSTIVATHDGKTGTASVTVADADFLAIAIYPSNAVIAKGTTQQFVAIGSYSDGSTQDLSSNVTWSSSDATIAAISNADGSHGLGSGLGQGLVSITATFGAVSASTPFTTSAATLNAILITPASPILANGTTTQLTATGQYSDGSLQDLTAAVSWDAGSLAVAQISSAADSTGLLTALGTGTGAITATWAGVTGRAALSVTPATLVAIAIAPRAVLSTLGAAQQFTATATFSDGSTQDLTSAVTWSSSDTTVASISNAAGQKGLASSEALGPTIILASLSGLSGLSSKTDSTTLTVN